MTLVAATALVACGPSKADKEKAEKMKADSIHMADSIANAAKAAEMAPAEAPVDTTAAAPATEEKK